MTRARLKELRLWTLPRWLALALWAAAVVAVCARGAEWLSTLTYPGTPQRMAGSMIDFRDTIWGPGRYLLNGGNPYDHAAYLAANPGAQEFDPYAPAWLLFAVPHAALPFTVAAAVYLALGLVLAVVLLRTVCAWAAPRLLRIGVPALLLYMCAWAPGQYSLQNSGALLVALGWVLVVRDVLEHAPVARAVGRPRGDGDDPVRVRAVAPSGTWSAAFGLALALLKPQFGLPLIVVTLSVGRWAVVWRGAVVLMAASVPAIVACSVNAGGVDRFLGSIVELVGYASSPSAQTGLGSADNSRSDLLGMLARLTGAAPAAWLGIVVPIAVLAATVLVVRRAREPLTIVTSVAAGTLLPVVHQSYDDIILVAPAVVALDMLIIRQPLPPVETIVGLLGLVPMLKLHRLAQVVAPESGNVGAELPGVAALTAALALATVVTFTPRYQVSLTKPPVPS